MQADTVIPVADKEATRKGAHLHTDGCKIDGMVMQIQLQRIKAVMRKKKRQQQQMKHIVNERSGVMRFYC